jgi:hypothetical protein
MAVGWKLLLPAALVNVLLTSVGVLTNTLVLVALEVAATVGFFVLVSWLGEHAGDRLRAEAAVRVGHAPALRQPASARNQLSEAVASPEAEGVGA